MKKTFLSICLSTILFVLSAQNKSEILLTIGDESITVHEFINTFNRNNSFSKATETEVKDYIDLYIRFKLKVKEGLEIKIDTGATFQKELTAYKKQSSQSYFEDREVTENLINEAIERSKLMVRASHILIICDIDASPKDSLSAYNKALDIRKKITSGTITFPEAAVLFSEDPSARDEIGKKGKPQIGNKGDLGYFTVFDLIYPFETVAYNTPVDKISMPLRTQFGYHLIWVQDKQPMVSKINISQILLLDTTARFGKIIPEVKEKLDLIENALKNGEDFSTLAQQYTDDPVSKEKGGNVEPFSYNRREGDFVKQCISLQQNQISKPFSSTVGWQIIRLNELIVPNNTNEELHATVSTRIKRDSRSAKGADVVVERLKKEYNYLEKGKKAAIDLLAKRMETEKILLDDEELMAIVGIDKLKPMATFANQTITVQDFIGFIARYKGMEFNAQMTTLLNKQFDSYSKERLFQYEFAHLETKYPEYKILINEYHYGMILFEMNNERLWSESLKDNGNLETFYEEVKYNYSDENGNPKPLSSIRSTVLTDYQGELERQWLNRLKEKYPVWLNEPLLESLIKNK
jgi:peptidyl-prolyl cis-trans isomerase SurA